MRLNKFLLLLIILIKCSSEGLCQNTTKNTSDTLCRPLNELKLVYSDALRYRLTDSLLKLSELQLAEKKEQVRLLEEQGAEVSSNHRKEITNLENQIGVLKDQVNGFEKLWKREKRRRKLSQAGGILAVAAAIFLSTK